MPDPRYLKFIDLFNNEHFYEAHEVLEELWLQTSGDLKSFYKGLIQCAVALAHWQRKNPRGMKQVGERSMNALKSFDSETEGILLQKLLNDFQMFLASPDSNFPRIQTTRN